MAEPAVTIRAAVAVTAALFALGACGGDSVGETTAVETSASGCRPTERPEPREPEPREPPAGSLDPKETNELVVETNCGAFTITLDLASAPNAAASVAALADDGYFDNTIFHRIVPGFVIQGGDPTASGTGGPGYTTVDPPDAGTAYRQGTVAMAKAGNERRGAAGSQFFVVTGPDVSLPPDYAVIGRVSGGFDVVERIGRLGDENEQPTETVVIERMRTRGG